MSQPLPEERLVAPQHRRSFILLTCCFALWGLVNAMAEALVPAFKNIFVELSHLGTATSLAAHYGAYAVLAIPASLCMKRYGYKRCLLIGLSIFIIGVLGYIPASIFHSFNICLGSIFVYASACSILETTCNPCVLALGEQQNAVRRLNLAQAFNPVGSLLGLLMGKYLIFANIVEATPQKTLDSAQLKSNMLWMITPYMAMAALAIILWIAIKTSDFSHLQLPEKLGNTRSIAKQIAHLLRRPHYIFGVISQFFYVGLQTIAWSYIIDYAKLALGYDGSRGMNCYIAAMLCFVIMRMLCTWLMRYVAPARLLVIMAAAAALLVLATIYLPGSYGLPALIALSGCLSLMFPTIYGLALSGLGDEVKLGAAGLIMSIVGGALLPLVFAHNLDKGYLNCFLDVNIYLEQSNMRSSFFIALLCILVILGYALANMPKKSPANTVAQS